MSDNELDSDVSSTLSWSDSDTEAGPKYSTTAGTVVWPETEARKIPILTLNDTCGTESYGGLRLNILSKIRRFSNLRNQAESFMKREQMLKMHIPIRAEPYMGEERSILMGDGQDSFIPVWCPQYSPYAPDITELRRTNWSCVVDFHPNIVRTEMKQLGAGENERGVRFTSSTLSQFAFPVEDTLQSSGLVLEPGTRFPVNPVWAQGQGVCDTNTYKWRSSNMLPSWLTEAEQSNSMGFYRMTTYFPSKARKDINDLLSCPDAGSYPFHVLLLIPRSSQFLQTKFQRSLSNGRYLRSEGKRMLFAGYFVGMLNTAFLKSCPAHVQIPVIVPRELSAMGTAPTSAGAFGRSISASPAKRRHTDVSTEDNGGPSSSQAAPDSPTPMDRRAKQKALMKARAKLSWQKQSQPEGDVNGGPSTATPSSSQAQSVDLTSDTQQTNTTLSSVDEENTQGTASDKGKGKETARTDEAADAGSSSTKGKEKETSSRDGTADGGSSAPLHPKKKSRRS